MKKLGIIGSVVALMVGIVSLIQFGAGYDIRWWVWRYEHRALANTVDKEVMLLAGRIDENDLERIKNRYYKRLSLKREMEKKRLTVPDELHDEIQLLKKKKDRLERKLNRIN